MLPNPEPRTPNTPRESSSSMGTLMTEPSMAEDYGIAHQTTKSSKPLMGNQGLPPTALNDLIASY